MRNYAYTFTRRNILNEIEIARPPSKFNSVRPRLFSPTSQRSGLVDAMALTKLQ